ncbi:hypothetical protein L7F22_050551 [Adiantum nelumboides]|nr:hypothetical protein [Adiantum nelumboides]
MVFLVSGRDDEATKLRAFPLVLREGAKAWYQTLAPEERRDWETLKTAFIEEFRHQEPPEEIWRQLLELRQTSPNDYRSYEGKFSNLWEKWCASLGEGERAPECLKKDCFLAGLYPILREKVKVKFPDTFEKAMAYAREKDRKLKFQAQLQGGMELPPPAQPIARTVAGTSVTDQESSQQELLQQITNQLESLSINLVQGVRAPQSGNDRNRQEGQRQTREYVYYNCGEVGHGMYFCPHPRRYQVNGNHRRAPRQQVTPPRAMPPNGQQNAPVAPPVQILRPPPPPPQTPAEISPLPSGGEDRAVSVINVVVHEDQVVAGFEDQSAKKFVEEDSQHGVQGNHWHDQEKSEDPLIDDSESSDSTRDGEKEPKLGSPVSAPDGETKTKVNDPNWEWPCFERTFQKGRWDTKRAAAKSTGSSAKWPFEVLTIVQPDETDEIDTGVAAVDDLSESQQRVWHVKHLLRFVEGHFADNLVQYKRMKTEGCVSFEMLWTFFEPGEGVRRKCLVTNQECFATVSKPAAYKTDASGMQYCFLKLNVMDFNVQSYHRCTINYKIPLFDGEVPFTSLQVCPLRFFPNGKQIEAHFVSMGGLFYQVAMQQPFRFMQFKGSMNFFSLDSGSRHKLNADGRAMVDLLSFARMNADYPLENAEPPCEVMTGLWSSTGLMKQPSDEELMLAPAFAYGFSFGLKKWGCFELCGLREIIFNEGAFDALRMKDESQKMMLWSVVQPYVVINGIGSASMQSEQQLDPIANKGTGCIVLCHGPSGTGKTLTAEALAESMLCPLWSVSAFELGEEPEKVEAKLSQIMEIAYNWHAILLLDEADAYLQRRDVGVDVQRNLLMGVFLQVLEYHKRIVFLTTNRVTAFDDAILSRTTLAISYPALEETQRRQIWKKLLQRAGIHNATYDALLHHELNGRQIRNIVHLAQLLAAGRKQTPTITHVIDAINAYVSCAKDLPLLTST